MKKLLAALVTTVALVGGVTACGTTDADVVNQNMTKDADNFRINRQIVFYNGITNEYIAEFTGLCQTDDNGRRVAVTCKVGDGQYIRNFIGKADNVTYVVLQTDPSAVSSSQYKVVFKPSSIVPNFEIN